MPLIKYPAQANSSDGSYQGMILLNPGGPGASGVDEARNNGSFIQAAVGTNWDIVGFDTRGMWLSEPVLNCTASSTHRRSVPRVTDDFYEMFIDYGKALGANCEQTGGGGKDAGPHMTTAVTARDMLSVVNAFAETEDGKRAPKSHLLNYYGISYGTFLGQTYASMFPDRVGRVALDGVVSPQGYLSNFTSASVTHLDGVLALFFVYCYEAGEGCAFNGSSPKVIYERFHRSFVQLDPRHAEAKHWSNATDLEAALLTLKVALLTVAVSPLSYFGQLPSILLGLEAAIAAKNIRPWTAALGSIVGDPGVSGYSNAQWALGVLCADQGNKYYQKNLQDLRPLISDLEKQSIVGEVWIKTELGCTGWPIKSLDRYTGPFRGNTATPILFVSNTYDPVTPIEKSVLPHPNDMVLTRAAACRLHRITRTPKCSRLMEWV